jgi:hypothetical protein
MFKNERILIVFSVAFAVFYVDLGIWGVSFNEIFTTNHVNSHNKTYSIIKSEFLCLKLIISFRKLYSNIT